MNQLPKPALVVIGAGGHAKVVIDLARRAGFDPVAVLDDDSRKLGQLVANVPVIGDRSMLSVLRDQGVLHALVGIGANTARLQIADWLNSEGMNCPVAVHPAATVDDSARFGAGTVVMAGAVINADAHIGCHCIVNTAATIDHDCEIGDGVHFAPGVNLCGNVVVGVGALIGVGASVAPGKTIGDFATVGAGAAVVKDVAPRTTVVGVPARVLDKG